MGPWLFSLVGLIFLGLGFLTIFLARKRMRHARALGQPIAWYKDLTFLTGLEYVLLGVNVFLNQLKDWIPAPLKPAFAFFFASIIILTVILLLIVVFRLLKQPRQTRQIPKPVAATKADTRSPEERTADVQRKRERRQKAAAARRRQAGRV